MIPFQKMLLRLYKSLTLSRYDSLSKDAFTSIEVINTVKISLWQATQTFQIHYL